MNKKITIIGGAGQMGLLFKRYFSNLNHQVFIIDKDDWNDKAIYNLGNCDLALISVPIDSTIEIIKKTSSHLSKNAILADLTSIKVAPLQAMLEYHSGPVVGLHPTFGPTIATAKHQVILECSGRGDYSWFINDLKKIGFTLKSLTASEHDLVMTFIQGIEHFTTFVLGSFLTKLNIQPSKLFNYASPIYQSKLTLLGRIFNQDAGLYANIICSDDNRKQLILEFSNYLSDWAKTIATDSNAKNLFIDEFNKSKGWMGDFTNRSQSLSDKYLNSVIDSFNASK
jgi:chorismate mutase/prephenate dehydrogenase